MSSVSNSSTACTLVVGYSELVLKTLTSESVDCCVTSPPYFGLRDYDSDYIDQLGLEPTVELYVANLVAVFTEVYRVLKNTGTVWLVIGDSYARAGGWSNNSGLDGVSRSEGRRARSNMTGAGGKSQRLPPGYKQKDLLGVPWRVALALQSSGWYLRQDIIWHKPNPIPEAVKDRCTKSHEYIFLLSKRPKYYFNSNNMREPTVNGLATRNKHSVWSTATKPLTGYHPATYPIELITPCILSGCPAGGVVLDPFNGSGTTAIVSLGNGMRYIGIDTNEEYIRLSKARVLQAGFAATVMSDSI